MIDYAEQQKLFGTIAKYLSDDITCYAFGGTAMMYFGCKEQTKDIDMLFENTDLRDKFIQAIKKLGFSETSPFKIYIAEKLRDKFRPLMFSFAQIRFDLFAGKIFHTVLSPLMLEDFFAVHEFKEKHTLTVKTLSPEHIFMLKAVTERQNDFDDIRTILERRPDFNWQYLLDETIWQYKKGDNWVLYDVEKTLQELKEYIFIPETYIQKLRSAVQESGKGEKQNLTKTAKTKQKKEKLSMQKKLFKR